MHKVWSLFGFVSLLLSLQASSSLAADLNVNGTGKAAITADISLTRSSSFQDAKRNAVLNAIKKVNGIDAGTDPKILGMLDAIAEQVGNEYVSDQSTSRDASNNFVTSIKLKLDDKEFRKLISDHGIAVKTANSFPILIVMDEFFTTPTDSAKPLREVVEYFSDKSSHAKQDQSSSASSSDNSSLNAHKEISVHAYDNSASAAGHANLSAQSQSQSANSSSSSSESAQNDVQSYRKAVEYQPQNLGPSEQSFTYEALLREAASYDLNVLDNSLFRSKYFTGKPMTLQEITNGNELAKYVKAAFEVAKADYFMAGTTIIYDLGKNSSSGMFACDGVVSIKAYSTTDGKVLAADARTESASGSSPDQCRVNVANKLATFTASVLGRDISEYWKNRNMYGRQYSIQFISLNGQFNFQSKKGVTKIISALNGVKEVPQKRSDDAKQIEYSVQYVGETPIGDALGDIVSSSELGKTFPNFDVSTSGSVVRVCLDGSCPKN